MKFYLKPSKSDTCLIMMVIYDSQFKDSTFKYSTREKILKSQWNNKTNMPKSGNETLTHRLLEIQKDAVDFIRLNRKSLTRESLSSYLDSLRPNEGASISEESTILEKWAAYLDSLKGTINRRTHHNYVNCYKAFEGFMSNRKLTTVSQFDLKMYNEFKSYLNSKFAPNTAARILLNFKRALNYMSESGDKPSFNLSEIKYKETSGVQISLTLEELEKLEALELDSDLSDARWLFLLQCYTGLRVSDLMRLKDNIRNDYIIIETKKIRGKSVKQPLTKPVIRILEKCGGNPPLISETEYRKRIKQIYKLINPHGTIQVRKREGFVNVPIWQEISTHDAVRTFITICDQKGMAHSSISTMVGKSLATILKHYLVKSQTFAEKEMLEKW